MTEKTAKAGTLMVIEEGSYSDYQVIGFFVVLKDFEPATELKEYLVERPTQAERHRFQQDEYVAYLLRKGLLLEIHYGTLHLCDYSDVADFRFTPVMETDYE